MFLHINYLTNKMYFYTNDFLFFRPMDTIKRRTITF